ncbi:261_t:CDS:2 [Entrophospora sp. SA101]|nr:261_t:CDS:2 [Entrophospora sp. SA101]
MGLEAEENRVLEPMDINYANINLANKLDQCEELPGPNPSINIVRNSRVDNGPLLRKCKIYENQIIPT